MTAAPTLILASQSGIRAKMLRDAGLAPEIVPADVEERAVEAGLREGGSEPAEVARRLAEAKALAVSRLRPEAVVIGADQTLALGALRFTKAATLSAAREQLQTLRGQRHSLHSGFALARAGSLLDGGVQSAHLAMRSFSDAFLDRYLEAAGPAILGSVGCYQLEGLGVTLFDSVEGDHFTVLGLPLLPVLAALRRHGMIEA